MDASITVHLQIFKRPQLLRFLTDLDETGIKIHGLIQFTKTVIIMVAISFHIVDIYGILSYKRIHLHNCGTKINFDTLTTQ